jgi:hypothetical protein
MAAIADGRLAPGVVDIGAAGTATITTKAAIVPKAVVRKAQISRDNGRPGTTTAAGNRS